MKAIKLFISILLTLAVGQSCSPERKSASYYQENKKEINELKNEYDALYRQQAFSAGFTDKTFKYYVMQIITDTLRAIYNSEKRKDELWQNVLRFHYDTVALKKMAAMMKKIKCLWVEKLIVILVRKEKCSLTFLFNLQIEHSGKINIMY